jgi:hypothetical protein
MEIPAMKKLMLSLSLLLVASLVYAQAPPPAPPQPVPPDQPAGRVDRPQNDDTQQVEAEIVSVDTTKKTVTIKSDPGAAPETLPVEGKAETALKDIKTGQKYTLVCKNDTTGANKKVVDIKSTSSKSEPR